MIGSSSKPTYNGEHLARERGVVVVAPNYSEAVGLGRLIVKVHVCHGTASIPAGLGAFGFAALYSLQLEDSSLSTGNIALRDQTAALEWTRDNIANFGGDPDRVHLFGQSAGGFSVAWHLVSSASAGLFTSATMESGTTDATQFFTPLRDAVAFTELFAIACGCNMTSIPALVSDDPLLRCLRALPTKDLMRSLFSIFDPNWPLPPLSGQARIAAPRQNLPPLAPFMAWGPAIDGSKQGLRALPLELIQKGDFNRVSVAFDNVPSGGVYSCSSITGPLHARYKC